MNKFTNKIDFQLTKKRLRMISAQFSWMKSSFSFAVLTPVLAVLVISTCTNSSENYYYIRDVEIVYDFEKSKELSLESSTMFDVHGEPYTGEVNLTNPVTGKLWASQIYKDGIVVEATFFGEHIDQQRTYTHARFFGDRILTKVENGTGVVLKEIVLPSENDEGIGWERNWHENGELKFEASFRGYFKYDGLMTLYDEQGEILQQELYENGELSKKIK